MYSIIINSIFCFFKKEKFPFFYILIILLPLGLWGGTTYFHPDNLLKFSQAAILNNGNPGHFNYPAFVIYALATVYGILFTGLYTFGFVDSLADYKTLARESVISKQPFFIDFELFGHFLILSFSFLALFSVYKIVLRITHSRLASGLSSLLLSVSPLWVADSHMLTTDIPCAAMAVATVALIIRFEKSNITIPRLLIIGALVGVSAACKYNVGIVIFAAFALLYIKKVSLRLFITQSIIVGSFSLFIFFLINPYLILEYETVIKNFSSLMNSAANGTIGLHEQSPYQYHFFNSLRFGIGTVPLILILFGIIFFIFSKQYSSCTKIVLLCFPVLYFYKMGNVHMAANRYMLPILPFLCVFFGVFVQFIKQKVFSKLTPFYSTIVICLLTAIIIYSPLKESLYHNLLLSREDSRQHLASLLTTNEELFADKLSLRERYSHVLKRDLLLVRPDDIRFPSENSFSILTKDKNFEYDYLVLDSFSLSPLLDNRYEDHMVDLHNQYLESIQDFILKSKTLIIINPYKRKSPKINHISKARFSPYHPDLFSRNLPGPYIEVYTRENFRNANLSLNNVTSLTSPEEGIFYKKLEDKFRNFD